MRLCNLLISVPINFHDAITTIFKNIDQAYLFKFIKYCYYQVLTFSVYDINRMTHLIERLFVELKECRTVMIIMHCYLTSFLFENTNCSSFVQLHISVLEKITKLGCQSDILVYTSKLICETAQSILQETNDRILRTGIVALKNMYDFAKVNIK